MRSGMLVAIFTARTTWCILRP